MTALEEFLMFSYFKITEDDFADEETIILKCAERAYLDLCRTLRFNKKSTEKDHEKFSNEISKKIAEKLIPQILETKTKKSFIDKHKFVCEDIMKRAQNYTVENKGINILENENRFHYGHAQKWLNMTLKYMYLIGCRSEFFSKHENYMHVPVDSIIIDAVWNETEIELSLKGDPKDKDKIRSTPYKKPSDHVKAWSQWEYEKEYKNFQSSLHDYIKALEPKTTPLEWEAKIWIEYAKKEKGEKENDKIN